MHNQVYLDYASSAPVDNEVYHTYIKLVKDCFYNSEAVYNAGVDVNRLVETSRKQIAKLLNVNAEELIFTSGASEANSFAIKGYALANQQKGKHLISSAMEHSSVLQSLLQLRDQFGFELTLLPIGENGCVNPNDLKKAMREDTILVSMMAVNNEIGSIQNIKSFSEIVHQSSKAKLHVDAVQAIAKINVNFTDIDMVTLTAHKLYGIKGCGLLYCKNNIKLLPLINGGQQEQGLRGGTLNAPSCIVFAKTLRLAKTMQDTHFVYVSQLNKYTRKCLQLIEDIRINSPLNASPYILNFSCLSITSEIMMNALNAKGICVSSQSTCSSRTKAPSHTLTAMNLDEKITYGAIRVSFSHLTSRDEIDYLLVSLKEIINEYRTK